VSVLSFEFWRPWTADPQFYLDGCSSGLIRLNDDDDDENGTVDFDDGETEEEDGELEEVQLCFSPGWCLVGQIRIEPTDSRLKVWADEQKSELIAEYGSPGFLDPCDLDPTKNMTVWLEGRSSSGGTGLDMDYVSCSPLAAADCEAGGGAGGCC